MSGEKILVADDRRENLVFLAESVLRPEGYQVITAMDGREAFSKALAEKPDLVITDLKMPRMSGLEMMSALRKADSNIPVILTTFYGSEQTAIQAFRLGARDYLVKPYEVTDMLESVERALIEVRLRRETNDLKEGAEVRRHLEGRVRQLNSLCGIGKALNAIHDPDEMMRVTVEAAIYLTGAERGQFFLANPEAQHLELRAVRESSEGRATSVRQAGVDSIAARVLETGQAVLAERDDREEKISCLAVPLRTEQQIIGVLGIDAKPAHLFDQNDSYQLSILANFAVVALGNAQLIAGLKDGAAVRTEGTDTVEEGLAPGLADSVAEARRLSAELRHLADSVQGLADKLQSTSQ
ncbi:MAG: response regulator [Anaerolineae bacterium]|jgi:two-component system NtrC family sensor kinase